MSFELFSLEFFSRRPKINSVLTSISEEPLDFGLKNWYFQTEPGSIPEPRASERGCSTIPPTLLEQKYVLTIILGRRSAVQNKF